MYMEKGLDTGDMIDKAEVVLDRKKQLVLCMIN